MEVGMNEKVDEGEWLNQIICGDALDVLKQIPDNFVDCIITSPPYWGLRDYGVDGQIGLEKTLEEYLEKLLEITNELKRVLKSSGVMFWNHGDCYGGIVNFTHTSYQAGRKELEVCKLLRKASQARKAYPSKCLTFQNFRLVTRMIDEQGWLLRNVIIWYKHNYMPEPAKDRFTRSYEPIFMLVKTRKYWFDFASVKTYIKHTGDVWVISTSSSEKSSKGERVGHFATFPERLVEPMIRCGCPKDGIVLDPFVGSGTTCIVAKKLGRNYIGIDINSEYVEMAKKRLERVVRVLDLYE
jgi:site-specific DNA-methyltransferase (adenine-specific)